MEPIDLATATHLIDFSAGKPELVPLGSQQLEGALALHNLLAQKKVAYLADEVGMGKTYIALGVVALMRRFNPSLRVLYLLPKNNVRDKWEKDYRSFIEYNYRCRDLSVKGLDNRPAATYAVCSSITELVQSVATDSARDYFITTSAFSLALGNTIQDLNNSLNSFVRLLPQHRNRVDPLRLQLKDDIDYADLGGIKAEIKNQWALALNAILPRFDLVVVDEAHNLKKSRTSSDRNLLLSLLLGADDEPRNRVGRLLLLSATPFDRQLDHLRNQLDLFGFKNSVTLPDGNTIDEPAHHAIAQIMVRRLNKIDLSGKSHTRNMYRTEYRSGERAEVVMSLEQQLFAGLLQKKVSEYLQENCAGRFELGMLASFESYLPGEKNKAIEFDGNDDRDSDSDSDMAKRDARDRHIVESLVEDYLQTFKNTPPHPKMDWVTEQIHSLSMDQGKKQLVFVRRVKSVSELKFKLERAYDDWLARYIEDDQAVRAWFEVYKDQKRDRNTTLQDMVGHNEGDDIEATGENFFTWFYRGKNTGLEATGNETLDILPFNFRNWLGQISIIFEPNWTSLEGMPKPQLVKIDWEKLVPRGTRTSTRQLRFRHAQYAYLCSVREQGDKQAQKVADRILSVAFPNFKAELDIATPSNLAQDLTQKTLADHLRATPNLAELYPKWDIDIFNELAIDGEESTRLLRKHLTHFELIGVVCRLDHPFIDLYALRHKRNEKEDDSSDSSLIAAFVDLLDKQVETGTPFCTYQILNDVAKNLELIVKLNFPDAYHVKTGELTKYLTRQLNPLAPISGATGENSNNRSPLARKFRMPGYPRVLISTDVFQEGEDLHTFCDSVIHYGISSSPIALEQKVGRIDRVASMAHRNMLNAGSGYQQHFIQVNYPHIRQSLEFFQVRQAAANLNKFLISMHTIGGEQLFSPEVDIQQHLKSQDGIEAQISEPLESLFKVKAEDIRGMNHVERIQHQQLRVDKRIDHVRNLIQNCLAEVFAPDEGAPQMQRALEGWSWKSQHAPAVEIQLRNAIGSPELLFSVSLRDDQDINVQSVDPTERIDFLKKLQADPLFRLQLFDDKIDKIILKRNSELYAGQKGILIGNEIKDAIKRVRYPRLATTFPFVAVKSNSILDMLDKLQGDNWLMSITKQDDHHLTYFFKNDGQKQTVEWQIFGEYFLASSKVLDVSQTLALANEDKLFFDSILVECTLRRNARFDLVDFYIDQERSLSVRSIHPVQHLNQEELAFLMLTVASEADRLEHILIGHDL